MPSDLGGAEHQLAMRLIEIALCYDQLNITELACFELIFRKAQLAEMRHREKMIGHNASDDMVEDEYLFLGIGETRRLVMVCPQLVDHMSEQLDNEASI